MYIILLLILLILLYIHLLIQSSSFSNHIPVAVRPKRWFQCPATSHSNSLFHSVLNNHHLIQTLGNDWDLYLPCNNQYGLSHFRQLQPSNNKQIISFISHNGTIGSKEYIWKMLIKRYGRSRASSIMPNSFIFPKDKPIFDKLFSPKKFYIMKSEAQRQTGLKLSNNYHEIINSRKRNYKIVQEFIEHPLSFNGHKLNFRVYLVIVCSNSKQSAYIFHDGIISYSKTPSHSLSTLPSKSRLHFDSAIASFYSSKPLYRSGYPITFRELSQHLPFLQRPILLNFFSPLLVQVLNACSPLICQHQLSHHNTTFQLFGADFLLARQHLTLTPYLLEINIGPGMTPFCQRDKLLREQLHQSILAVTNIINPSNNIGLVKFWSN